MKLFHTTDGILIDLNQEYYLLEESWDILFTKEKVYDFLIQYCLGRHPFSIGSDLLQYSLLPPIKSQEVWASGVTYYRSKIERQKESAHSGGGTFYDRVYHADRPELFFKASPHRVSGHNQIVKIRKDSIWNVPEPELTLAINQAGTIFGYTIGNDLSSRSIEGENPLYLAQAKTYDRSAALGPGILVPKTAFDMQQSIYLIIKRLGESVFEESISINQMKRTPMELVNYLFRECSFPTGCFLMTGTGIIPPDNFTLENGDEIHITIDSIGTLINTVA